MAVNVLMTALLCMMLALAASVEVEDFNQVTHSSAKIRHHSVSRRDNGEMCDYDQLRYLHCETDYVTAVETTARENNCFLKYIHFRPTFLLRFADYSSIGNCGTDRNGDLCAQHLRGYYSQDGEYFNTVDAILSKCFFNKEKYGDDPDQIQPLTCLEECKRALQEFANKFDCCVHSSPNGIVLAPGLWSNCGVQRPEPCSDTPKINFPSGEETYTCSLQCARTQAYAIDCRYYVHRQVEIYKSCGENSNSILDHCYFNHNDVFCSVSPHIDDDTLLSVYTQCYKVITGGDTCSAECRNKLQELSDTHGCCINHNYNGTDPAYTDSDNTLIADHIFRYDLWSTCRVKTPGNCIIPTDLSRYDDLVRCSESD